MMEESARFLSLSGLSGISAGLIAITGSVIAYIFILLNGTISFQDYLNVMTPEETVTVRWQLFAVAAGVLLLSVLSALFFSFRKARREGKLVWSPVSRRLLVSLLVPLATGGIFAIILLFRNELQMVVPVLLIFYGLALVNGGKFTFGEVFYLGLLEILTGVVAMLVPGFGIIFWIIGFGLLHIIYGLLLYRKYEA